MTEPSTDGLRAAIADFVTITEKVRDGAAVASLVSTDEIEAANLRGRWSSYALTLAALHECTGGEFGTPYEEQPSPLGTQGGGVR